jgi:hypothetical protein
MRCASTQTQLMNVTYTVPNVLLFKNKYRRVWPHFYHKRVPVSQRRRLRQRLADGRSPDMIQIHHFNEKVPSQNMTLSSEILAVRMNIVTEYETPVNSRLFYFTQCSKYFLKESAAGTIAGKGLASLIDVECPTMLLSL